jgi:hypothetical protein
MAQRKLTLKNICRKAVSINEIGLTLMPNQYIDLFHLARKGTDLSILNYSINSGTIKTLRKNGQVILINGEPDSYISPIEMSLVPMVAKKMTPSIEDAGIDDEFLLDDELDKRINDWVKPDEQ